MKLESLQAGLTGPGIRFTLWADIWRPGGREGPNGRRGVVLSGECSSGAWPGSGKVSTEKQIRRTMNQPLSLSLAAFSPSGQWVSKSVLCAYVCVCVECLPDKTFVLPEDVRLQDRDFLFLSSIFLLSNYLSTLPTNVCAAQGNTTLRNTSSWNLGSREGESCAMSARSLGSDKCWKA